jgi:hypothetical protein
MVGNPPQIMYVLPSTAATSTWVVGWMGCANGWNTSVMPYNCNITRGFTFTNDTSTTWKEKGYYGLKVEEYLGTTTEGGKPYFHTNILFPSVGARKPGAVLGAGTTPLSLCLGSLALRLLRFPFQIKKIPY